VEVLVDFHVQLQLHLEGQFLLELLDLFVALFAGVQLDDAFDFLVKFSRELMFRFQLVENPDVLSEFFLLRIVLRNYLREETSREGK